MQRPSDKVNLAVLLGIPILVGLLLGANQTRAGANLPWLLSIGYWIAISVATWLLMALGTLLVSIILRPWSAPDWFLWILGAVAGSLAARPVIYGAAELLKPFMQGESLRRMPQVTLSADFFQYYITNWSIVIGMWVAICWLQKAWLTVQMQNTLQMISTNAGDGKGSNAIPKAPYTAFLEKLPPAMGRDIVALHSEDHYVRVYTRLGDTLILATISDAIAKLEALGIAGQRVHRSWWIAIGAVARVETQGRRVTAILENGIEIPVSQTYRELARHAGALSGHPVAMT